MSRKTLQFAVKRGVDLAGAAACLLLFSPLLLALAILVRFRMGKPVLFRQVRPGRHGIPFTIYKFRTMTPADDAPYSLDSDAERLTRLGRFLRNTSLDELPELFNVLKSDMSLVGPRPLLMEYLPRYNAEQARRNEVKPGITGWAQVNGRNILTWEEKFRLDVWYVDHWNPWLDLRILLVTAFKIFKREGITASGHATMPEFMGTPGSEKDDGRKDGR